MPTDPSALESARRIENAAADLAMQARAAEAAGLAELLNRAAMAANRAAASLQSGAASHPVIPGANGHRA